MSKETNNSLIIYKNSKDDKYRYALGTKGKNTLFCIGINPSTATPENYDMTMKLLKSFAEINNYNSWVMLNIYPQRTTDPDNLDKELNNTFHEKNLKIIEKYIHDNSNILCIWGTLIRKRKYLKVCLRDIYNVISKKRKISWLNIALTKKGNPGHLIGKKIVKGLYKFDICNYIKNMKIT